MKKAFFFQHRECEYFPCHETDDVSSFNCLFCYCPLYPLGRDCGGRYDYTPAGVKDCSRCLLPHLPDSFRQVEARFDDLARLAKN